MDERRKKINVFLFYVAYFLFTISILMSTVSFIEPYCRLLNISSMILISIVFVFQSEKYTFKEFSLILLLLLLSLFSYYITNNILLLNIALFLVASKNIELKEFIKKDFKIRLMIYLIIILLYFLGLTKSVIILRNDGTIRNAFGFVHPNHFAYHFMILMFEYTFLRDKTLKFIQWVIILLFSLLIDIISDSRTVFLIILIYYISNLFINKNLFNKKIIKSVNKNIFLLMFLLSFTLELLYINNTSIGLLLNDLTSQRIKYIDLFLMKYGVLPFGQPLLYVSSVNAAIYKSRIMILDNLYFRLLINYGYIYFILILCSSKLLIKRLYDNFEKNKKVIIIFVMLFAFGLMEFRFLEIESNPFLLFFSVLIFDDRKNDV